MPRNNSPVCGNRRLEKPIIIKGIDRSVMSANSRQSMRVPWRPASAATASLAALVGIGMLHPMLGEVMAVVEVVAVLTIIATALFGSGVLSERAFRLLRWFGDRPEPPTPGTPGAAAFGDGHASSTPP
jgi:hypothetical protein